LNDDLLVVNCRTGELQFFSLALELKKFAFEFIRDEFLVAPKHWVKQPISDFINNGSDCTFDVLEFFRRFRFFRFLKKLKLIWAPRNPGPCKDAMLRMVPFTPSERRIVSVYSSLWQ